MISALTQRAVIRRGEPPEQHQHREKRAGGTVAAEKVHGIITQAIKQMALCLLILIVILIVVKAEITIKNKNKNKNKDGVPPV